MIIVKLFWVLLEFLELPLHLPTQLLLLNQFLDPLIDIRLEFV
jgi:hypothetical protein